MNIDFIQNEIDSLDFDEKSRFLILYGHYLTIMARDAYEFQGAGVKKPRLLRDINEILHRVFQALRELEDDSENFFVLSGLAHWIACENREGDIVHASHQAFRMAINR